MVSVAGTKPLRQVSDTTPETLLAVTGKAVSATSAVTTLPAASVGVSAPAIATALLIPLATIVMLLPAVALPVNVICGSWWSIAVVETSCASCVCTSIALLALPTIVVALSPVATGI